MRRFFTFVGIILGFSGLSGMEKVIPVSQYKLITGIYNGNPVARWLIKVDLSVLPDNIRIDGAEMRVSGIELTGLDEGFTVELHPLTRDWDPNTVSWTYPWENPGGDYRGDIVSVISIPKDFSGTIGMDLTEIVGAWKNEITNYGLLLKSPDFEGGGFNAEEMGILLNGIPTLNLKVYYSMRDTLRILSRERGRKRAQR